MNSSQLYFGDMEMKVEILHDTESVFKATNPSGAEQVIDGAAISGLRPMESLLNAVASCAALDLLHILKKQRQIHNSLKIEVQGFRPDSGAPKPYQKISMHFILEGKLDREKVERAVKLSVEKYCSVGASLDPAISISHKTTLID